VQAACARSLRRMRTDRIDLYLLHWRGEFALEETVRGFIALRDAGKIRYFGVSNLDRSDMEELVAAPGADEVATNQLLYSLRFRGIEWELLPWLRKHRVPVMAYSPIDQGRLTRNTKLRAFAQRCGTTPARVALAWLLRNDDVIVIPKSARRARLEENLGALDLTLSPAQCEELDQLFPRPTSAQPLEML